MPPEIAPPAGRDTTIPDVLQGLDDRKVKFCQYFARTHNALKSGKLAGYQVDNTNNSTVYYLKENPAIQAGIAYYEELYGSATDYDGTKVIQELAAKASIDIPSLLNDDWSLKRKSELTLEQLAHLSIALESVEVTEKLESRTVKPKFAKLQSLIELAKIMGLYGKAGQADGGAGMALTIGVGVQVNVAGQAAPAPHALEVGGLAIHTTDQDAR